MLRNSSIGVLRLKLTGPSSLSLSSCTEWRYKDGWRHIFPSCAWTEVDRIWNCDVIRFPDLFHFYKANIKSQSHPEPMLNHNKLHENEQTPLGYIIYLETRKDHIYWKAAKVIVSMWAVRGRSRRGSCPAPFSCSDGDMLSLPPVDQSLVVLGYARVSRPEGKLVLYH